MCSSDLFDIIRTLENTFSFYSVDSMLDSYFKAYKVSKDHKLGDYICYASNRQCAQEASKLWESKCIEKMPWIKDYIQVTVAPHGFNISLSRKLCFFRGLEEVFQLGRKYGYDTQFVNKMFDISVLDRDKSDSLTNLRKDMVYEVLTIVIHACGGSVCEGGSDGEDHMKINITNKSTFCAGSVNMLIGPVVCKSEKSSILDQELYKRLRLNEIGSLSEHKLHDSDVENKHKLLKAIITFDLLQSNIWRSVRLNLTEKKKDERSSCKGSVFVMYNYARLHCLCAQFDEKVSLGLYPQLPPLNDTDFALLIHEEEWKVMFDSILCWPSVVRKSVIDLESGRPKLHLLVDFLKTTANNFSQYYHRIRIFMEPRNHLLPVLFARIHLLKALLIVFKNSLDLLCISPVNKM